MYIRNKLGHVFSLYLGLFITLNLLVCGNGNNNTGQAIDVSKLTQSCFVTTGSAPLLTTSSLFTGANWNDPSVLKVANN